MADSSQLGPWVRRFVCGTLSELVIGPTQAFCSNKTGCNVICFDPSLPDGGLSDAKFIDRSEEEMNA